MPPPPHPPPVPTDTRILEPDEQWKANLRKRIEHDLLHTVEGAQIVRDTILNSQPSESSRVRAQRDYEESMNNIRMLAQEEFNRILRQEMSERKWAFGVVDSDSSQWSLNDIRKTDEERTLFPPPDAPQNAKGVLSAGIPQQQSDSDSEQGPDESSEDDDDADDPHRHPLWRHGQGRQPYFPPHSGTERPPTQNHDRIVSNISIAPRLRQTSTSVSPQDRPSPPTYMTALRTIPGARPPFDEGVRFPTSARPSSRPMQQSPEEMRQGIAIPRGPTTPEEGPRGTSWGSLNSRRAFGDFNIKDKQRLPPIEGDLSDVSDDGWPNRQNVRSTRNILSTMNIEQLTAWWETEAQRKGDEANYKEEEASGKEEEARRLEEKARQSLEEARRLEAYARQAEASAKTREAEATKRGAKAQKRELEAQREEDTQYQEL